MNRFLSFTWVLAAVLVVGQGASAQPNVEAMVALQESRAQELAAQVRVLRDIRYADTPEKELLLDVYLPREEVATPRPCIVWIHGGGLTGLTKEYGITVWSAARTALEGFVSVSIEYRNMQEAPLPAAAVDCLTAIRYLRANAAEYGIDPKRIAVGGEGAGGILATFAAYANEWEELESDVYPAVSSEVSCAVIWYANTWRPFCALEHISVDDPPTLFVHGFNDKNVPIRTSESYLAGLQDKNVPGALFAISNAGHGLFDMAGDVAAYEQHMEDALAATVMFLRQHLQK